MTLPLNIFSYNYILCNLLINYKILRGIADSYYIIINCNWDFRVLRYFFLNMKLPSLNNFMFFVKFPTSCKLVFVTEWTKYSIHLDLVQHIQYVLSS